MTAQVWIDSADVSRQHARILVEPSGVRLEDLGSKNGTTVGDDPVTGPVALRDGDRIVVGGVVIVFRGSGIGASTRTVTRPMPPSVARGPAS
jgi:pSer/pThr/pTyr-binding forkhead associated (FHA) protein